MGQHRLGPIQLVLRRLATRLQAIETFWSNGSINPEQHGYDEPLQVEVPSTTGRLYSALPGLRWDDT